MVTFLHVLFMFVFQRLLAVLDELESLKPEFQRRVDELNEGHSGAGLPQLDGLELNSFGSEIYSLEWPAVNKNSYSSVDNRQVWTQLMHYIDSSSGHFLYLPIQFLGSFPSLLSLFLQYCVSLKMLFFHNVLSNII